MLLFVFCLCVCDVYVWLPKDQKLSDTLDLDLSHPM